MTEQKPKGIRYSENSSQATLWQFKKVIETGELRYLLILKDYEELPEFDIQVLNTVWQEIYQEFSDISGGNRADLWLLKVKRLTKMQLDYQRHVSILGLMEQCVKINVLFPLPDLIELAKDEGYMIVLDDFDKTFEKAYTRLMRMKNQMSIFKKEQEVEENANEPSLDELIVKLSKFQGYQFEEQKMSVKQFANIYKNYKDGQNN